MRPNEAREPTLADRQFEFWASAARRGCAGPLAARTLIEARAKRGRRIATLLLFGVFLLMIAGCTTLPDGRYGIPEGTVIYSPGDPSALFGPGSGRN